MLDGIPTFTGTFAWRDVAHSTPMADLRHMAMFAYHHPGPPTVRMNGRTFGLLCANRNPADLYGYRCSGPPVWTLAAIRELCRDEEWPTAPEVDDSIPDGQAWAEWPDGFKVVMLV